MLPFTHRTASAFAARMKSLSVSPLILCVHKVIFTRPHPSSMSGWWPCCSATSPTLFVKASASAKFGNLNVLSTWWLSINCQSECSSASSFPLCSSESGGTPPLHGTQSRLLRLQLSFIFCSLAWGIEKERLTRSRLGLNLQLSKTRKLHNIEQLLTG